MRKTTTVLLFLALLSLTAYAEDAPDVPEPPTPEAVARTYLGHLAVGEFEAAHAMSTVDMQTAAPAARLEGIWQQMVARAGAFASLGKAATWTVGALQVADVDATFGDWILTLRVTVDGDGKVAGFFQMGSRACRDDPHVVELDTGTGTLHGTLDLPEGEGPWPVALVIAGSGPTNRDGNNAGMQNDHLKLLGTGLAERGVATLRYDKRGIGASAAALTREDDLRFEHLVDDAARWVEKLRKDERFSRVVVIGHSEGSLVGMLAAAKTKPGAFVSIAGPGRRAADVLREQLEPQLLGPQGVFWKNAQAILAALEEGKTFEDVAPPLHSLFRPSVQPYLISYFRYDPAKEIGKLQMPVLILQGKRDIQVKPEDAEALAKALPAAKLVLLDEMNHVLKAPGDDPRQIESYTDPSKPVVEALFDALAPFVMEPAREKVPATD